MGISFQSIFGEYTTETVDGLNNTFKNTPLEPYVQYVIEFFFGETHRGTEYQLLNETRDNLRRHMDETIQLAFFLQALKSGVVKGKGWQIESDSDIIRISDFVLTIFYEKLDSLPRVATRYRWDEYSPVIPETWMASLEDYPKSASLNKGNTNRDGNSDDKNEQPYRLSSEEIQAVINDIKHFKRVVNSFKIEIDTSLPRRFVEFMIEKGVPRTRSIYRCLYKALECFDGIPADIKASHQSTISTSDPQSTYIKAFVDRYNKQQKKGES